MDDRDLWMRIKGPPAGDEVLALTRRSRPCGPEAQRCSQEDVDLLHTMLESQGHRKYPPRSRDIRTVVIDLGRR